MIVTVALNRRYIRPTIDIAVEGEPLPALIDTGAAVPITALGEARILRAGGRLVKRNILINGIGGECVGDQYRVDLTIGRLTYKDLPIIHVPNAKLDCPFILSATMLTGFRYTIDDRAKTLTIDTLSDERKLHVSAQDRFGGWRIYIGDVCD